MQYMDQHKGPHVFTCDDEWGLTFAWDGDAPVMLVFEATGLPYPEEGPVDITRAPSGMSNLMTAIMGMPQDAIGMVDMAAHRYVETLGECLEAMAAEESEAAAMAKAQDALENTGRQPACPRCGQEATGRSQPVGTYLLCPNGHKWSAP